VELVASLDQGHATSLVEYSLGIGSPVTVAGPLRLLLMIANGDWVTYGTEVPPGGSYVPGTGITPATFVLASPGTAVSAMPLTQKAMPACRITGGEIWDSVRRLWLGSLDEPEPVVAGDTFTVPAGSLVLKIGVP
jgi:hypothetical protein